MVSGCVLLYCNRNFIKRSKLEDDCTFRDYEGFLIANNVWV